MGDEILDTIADWDGHCHRSSCSQQPFSDPAVFDAAAEAGRRVVLVAGFDVESIVAQPSSE